MSNTAEESVDGSRIARLYAEGRTTFMGLTLLIAQGALIPRLETEILCRAALEKVARLRRPMHDTRVIDMCCGSGNLGCAIAAYEPSARVWASDLSPACVDIARKNAAHLALIDRVTVVRSNLFDGLGEFVGRGSIDLIVCNPPYISTHRLSSDRKELLLREPREAFDGGTYGLAIHQRVIAQSVPFLKPNGWLLFEVGLGQARQVERLFERSRSYGRCETRCDAAGNVRVVLAQRKESATLSPPLFQHEAA